MQHLVDSNVWLAFSLTDHPDHAATRAWFSGRDPQDTAVFCRSTQQSFLRLMTTKVVLATYNALPLTNAEVWAVYESFFAHNVIFVEEPAGTRSGWTPTWLHSRSAATFDS